MTQSSVAAQGLDRFLSSAREKRTLRISLTLTLFCALFLQQARHSHTKLPHAHFALRKKCDIMPGMRGARTQI